MKYLVMECHPGYAVVLDEEGRFLKAANLHYQVGQTVSRIEPMRERPPKIKQGRWFYSLAALAACLVLVIGALFHLENRPYASVYMRINPEVRIDVNRNNLAVGLEGINDDGRQLIQGYDYRKKELDTVMDELVELAIAADYLHEGGKITLTLDAENQAWVVEKEETLTSHLQEYLSQHLTYTIEIETNRAGDQSNQAEQGQEAVIPIHQGSASTEASGFGDSDYGESDYGGTWQESGDDDDDDGDDDDTLWEEPPSDSAYGSAGQSDYGLTDYGQTQPTSPAEEQDDSPYADEGQSDFDPED